MCIRDSLHAAFSEPWQRNTWGWRLAKGVFVSFGERFDWPDTQAADRGALGRCRALSDQLAVLSDLSLIHIFTSRVSCYAPPDTGVPNLQLATVEYLPSIEGAGRICRSAPFCGEGFLYLLCTL